MADHIRRVIAVLLGLMLSSVFAYAGTRAMRIRSSVEVEAAQLDDLYHDFTRLDAKSSGETRRLLEGYLTSLLEDEWPALARGERSERTDELFRGIEDVVLELPTENDYAQLLKSRLLTDIDEISDLRHARVYSAGSGLLGYVLLVLVAFSVVMTTFRFYEPTRWTRFYFIAYAALIGVVLYLTAAFYHPIRSGLVTAEPFVKLQRSISSADP